MQKKFATFLFFLLAVSNTLYPAASSAVQPLRGSVEVKHKLDSSLPSLDPSLAPGNIFNLDASTALLRNEIPQNVWYKIPTWLAGQWMLQKAISLIERSETTGITLKYHSMPPGHMDYYISDNDMEEGKISFGYFPTIDQQYWWQFADSGFWTKIEKGHDTVGYCFHQYIEPANLDSEDVQTKMVSIEFDVYDSKIYNVYRRQDLHTYAKLADDTVQTIDEARQYDFKGKPLWTWYLKKNMKRIGKPSAHYDTTPSGRNPIELILAYLQDRGLKDEYDNIIRITQSRKEETVK